MILFASIFKFRVPLFMLVAGLINFGVTNQVLQVFSKLVVGDLILELVENERLVTKK